MKNSLNFFLLQHSKSLFFLKYDSSENSNLKPIWKILKYPEIIIIIVHLRGRKLFKTCNASKSGSTSTSENQCSPSDYEKFEQFHYQTKLQVCVNCEAVGTDCKQPWIWVGRHVPLNTTSLCPYFFFRRFSYLLCSITKFKWTASVKYLRNIFGFLFKLINFSQIQISIILLGILFQYTSTVYFKAR